MNIDTRFKEGLLLTKELHFGEAIGAFDKVLQSEPLERNALLQRALTRIKRYQSNRLGTYLKDKKEILLVLEDLLAMPDDEQQRACNDLLLADEVDPSDYYVKKAVPEPILSYCNSKGIH